MVFQVKLGNYLVKVKHSWDRIQTTLILVVWDRQVGKKQNKLALMKYLRIRTHMWILLPLNIIVILTTQVVVVHPTIRIELINQVLQKQLVLRVQVKRSAF